MKPASTSHRRLLLMISLALTAAGCRNENPSDVQPELPADQTIVSEGVLVEVSAPDDQAPLPPAADLIIPGADQAHQKEIEEIEKKNTVTLEEIEATLYFGFDQASLSSEEMYDLKALSVQLKKLPNVAILIEGHTDERGPAIYNKDLGMRRAKSVADYLEAQGIKKSQMKLRSYGSERPAVTGYNKETWARNRRVELTVVAAG
ncbi:OmpA family protein [Sansalvadorimonas sp. 2012CJ34-2]|uniref:OmpA family protein n=1 Tax=Parendozoicomonas callyspongiae TaxID=2942213 RepID=A0ABT0PCS0_9GAMM|nr:OmpA family protein [Sansalvadorimonas sp. 2012CJ34-2]MCL6269178.1 OmpA family protein [Sansalvadorimonas sp. 2012CJ34-2]